MSSSGVATFINVQSNLTNMTSGLKMNLSSITKNLTDLKSNLTTNLSNLTNSTESSTTSNANANKTSSEPEIGFTLDLNQRDQEVAVTVTRAKNLPTKFGLKQVKGYFLKVKLYPGQKKYESNTVPVTSSSDTIFNEVFKFSVSRDPNKDIDKNNSSKFEKFSQKFIQKFGQKNKSDDAGKEENINKNFNANDAIDLNGFFVTITLCASMSDLMINENTYKAFKKTVDSYCETLVEKKMGNKKSKEENKKDDKKKINKPTPERPTVDSKRTIGTVTCTLTHVFDKSSLERGYFVKSRQVWKTIRDFKDMRESLSRTPTDDISPTSPNTRTSFFDASMSSESAVPRRCSVLDTSKGQVQISISYGDKMEIPKTNVEEERTDNVFSRKSLSRFSLRRFISQESPTDSKDDKEPSKEPIKESIQPQQVQRPANPFDRIITDLEDSDLEDEDDSTNPFKNEENENTSIGSLSYLCVRVDRIKCSRKVRDDLDLCGGYLYLKTYIVDDDRKLVSLQCPKFVLTSLSRHFDPMRSLLAYPCDEINLQYTSVKICLYNNDRLKKRTLLGTIKISEQDINELKNAKNETFTKWYCIV